jgi:hypothetical protein
MHAPNLVQKAVGHVNWAANRRAAPARALDGGYTRGHGRLQTSVENPNLKYFFGVLRARRAAMPPRRRAT